MIRRSPMGSILRPLVYVNRITAATAFIQCVDVQEPHIDEFWCLGLYRISRKLHSTAQLEVIHGTVGEFVTNHLAENGRIIQITRQLSVNNSVQFWGVPDQGWGSSFLFIYNLLDRVEAIGWGSGNYSNQYWGGSFDDAYSTTNVA